MSLGDSIKAKREALGMTQQELAEKLFVSRQTVSRWESGARCPDVIMSKRIAMVLGISLDDLITKETAAESPLMKEPAADFTCIKVMLTGIFLEVLAAFLIAADTDNMDWSAVCFVLGIICFAAGLCIPFHSGGKPMIDEGLPQKTCPRCGKEHDFDYPKCPHCQYDYTQK